MKGLLATIALLAACGGADQEALVLDWLEDGTRCGTEMERAGPLPSPVPDPWSRGLRAAVESTPDGRPFRWSRGSESRFSLTALQTSGRTLILDGFPAPSPDAMPQAVDVHVADAWLGRLQWSGPARHTLEIPDDVLRRGRNEVQLVYRYAMRPADLHPEGGDTRDLAMAWHEVGLDASSSSVWFRPTPTSGSVIWTTRGRASSEAEVAWWIDRGFDAWEELRRVSLSAGQEIDERLVVEGEPGSVARLGLAVLGGDVHWDEVRARGHAVDRRPVVLVTLDTTRRDALGSYAKGPATPTLDRLAAEGVVWEQAYAPTPTTAPTHASLLLSRWPAEHLLKINGHPLPRADGTHALVQAQAWGYDTAAFVSLGVLARDLAFDQGFHHFDDSLNQRWWRFAAEVNQRALPWIDAHPQGEGRPPGFLWVHYSDPHKPYGVADEFGQGMILELNGAALDTLATMGLEHSRSIPLRAGRNELRLVSRRDFGDDREHWFVCRKVEVDGAKVDFAGGWSEVQGFSRMRKEAVLSVHVPRAGSAPLQLILEDLPLPAEARRRYAQEVTAVDDAVRELLDRLDRAGWLARGLVMVVADHGEDLGENGHFGHVEHVGPTLTHVPMLLWARDLTPSRLSHPVSVIDVMPTLWSISKIPQPAAWTGLDARMPVEDRILRLETFPPEARRHWRGVVTPSARVARVMEDPSVFVGLDGSPLDDVSEVTARIWAQWPGEGGDEAETPDPAMQERLRALGYAN